MRYEKGCIQKFKDEWELKGKDQGQQNLPAINATYDEHEDELLRRSSEKVAELEESMTIHLGNRAKELTENKIRCKTLNVSGNLEERFVADEMVHLEMKFDQSYHKHKDIIGDAKKTLNQAMGYLNGFKDKNKLEREAKESKPHIYNFAIVGAVVLFEALLNAHFHQGEGGLIEGAVVAFCISFINVAIAMVLGFGFTYKNLYMSKKAVVLGWGCLLAFIVEAVYLNSLFATFRAEYNVLLSNPDLENVGKAATDAFGIALLKAHHVFFLDWPFKDMTSYLTFFVTLFFSCVAFYEGYVWDDPCPGYGERTREIAMLKKRHEDAEIAFNKELDEICLAAVEPFTKKIDEVMPVTPLKLYKMAAELEELHQYMMSDLELLNKETKCVVTAYREAGLRLRGDKMIPDIYKVEPKILVFSKVDSKYLETIRDFNSHAQEMEQAFSVLIRELNFINERFKNQSQVRKTEKREIYRREINQVASINATNTATLAYKGAA